MVLLTQTTKRMRPNYHSENTCNTKNPTMLTKAIISIHFIYSSFMKIRSFGPVARWMSYYHSPISTMHCLSGQDDNMAQTQRVGRTVGDWPWGLHIEMVYVVCYSVITKHRHILLLKVWSQCLHKGWTWRPQERHELGTQDGYSHNIGNMVSTQYIPISILL